MLFAGRNNVLLHKVAMTVIMLKFIIVKDIIQEQQEKDTHMLKKSHTGF